LLDLLIRCERELAESNARPCFLWCASSSIRLNTRLRWKKRPVVVGLAADLLRIASTRGSCSNDRRRPD